MNNETNETNQSGIEELKAELLQAKSELQDHLMADELRPLVNGLVHSDALFDIERRFKSEFSLSNGEFKSETYSSPADFVTRLKRECSYYWGGSSHNNPQQKEASLETLLRLAAERKDISEYARLRKKAA